MGILKVFEVKRIWKLDETKSPTKLIADVRFDDVYDDASTLSVQEVPRCLERTAPKYDLFQYYSKTVDVPLLCGRRTRYDGQG